jgi:hypothetical protein
MKAVWLVKKVFQHVERRKNRKTNHSSDFDAGHPFCVFMTGEMRGSRSKDDGGQWTAELCAAQRWVGKRNKVIKSQQKGAAMREVAQNPTSRYYILPMDG